jgi:uncharacterized protein YciI
MMAVAYFLVLLEPGPSYESEPEHGAAHVAFIETMEAANVVLLGGWFDSPVGDASAAYLLHVPSQADADSWAAKDPYVAHGVFRARVAAWNLVGIARSAIDPAFGS